MKRAEQLLLFLVLFFLPTQLGKHFWPNFSHIFSLKIDYLSPTIYFWDILVLILIAIFLINRKAFSKTSLNLGLFFLLTQIISLLAASLLVNNLNIGAALVRVAQYAIALLFGLYIASNKETSKRVLFFGISSAVIFQSLLGISQLISEKTIGFWILGERSFSISTPAIAKFDFYGSQFLRPYGTFPHPNLLAAFLIIGLILLEVCKKSLPNVKKIDKLFFSISMFLSAFGAILTFSRAAILVLICNLIFFTRSRNFLLVLLIIFLAPVLYTRFSSLFTYDNLSLLRREYLIEMSFNIFTKFPLTGIGLNNFIPFLSNDYIPGPGRFLQPVHNIYLLILAETGLIGLSGWIVLIGYGFIKKIKAFNFQAKIWFIILFLGLFDHYFLTLPQGYRLLFFVWGLTLSKSS